MPRACPYGTISGDKTSRMLRVSILSSPREMAWAKLAVGLIINCEIWKVEPPIGWDTVLAGRCRFHTESPNAWNS